MLSDQQMAISREAEAALRRLRSDELRFVARLMRVLPQAAQGYSVWEDRDDLDRVGACRDAARLLEALADAR